MDLGKSINEYVEHCPNNTGRKNNYYYYVRQLKFEEYGDLSNLVARITLTNTPTPKSGRVITKVESADLDCCSGNIHCPLTSTVRRIYFCITDAVRWPKLL